MFTVYYLAQRFMAQATEDYLKVISVAVGWALGQFLTNNLVGIVFAGWDYEIKTDLFMGAVYNNFDIVEIMGMTAMAWALTRKETT